MTAEIVLCWKKQFQNSWNWKIRNDGSFLFWQNRFLGRGGLGAMKRLSSALACLVLYMYIYIYINATYCIMSFKCANALIHLRRQPMSDVQSPPVVCRWQVQYTMQNNHLNTLLSAPLNAWTNDKRTRVALVGSIWLYVNTKLPRNVWPVQPASLQSTRLALVFVTIIDDSVDGFLFQSISNEHDAGH